jgi:hypothetical protein
MRVSYNGNTSAFQADAGGSIPPTRSNQTRYMNIIYTAAFLAAFYFVLIFVLARIVVPFLGFKKYPAPRDLPDEVRLAIAELEKRSFDQRSYLQAAYDFVRSRWHSERFKTITELPLAFRTDLKEIWQKSGYAHCTSINFILYALLANSKFFTPGDIRLRHTIFNLMIHQYLRVRVGKDWLDVEPSLVFLNLPVGQRPGFFG